MTIDEMNYALSRLERLLDDLRTFDPHTVKDRDDPDIGVLENSIDNFLAVTFGHGTREYNLYVKAKEIDTAPLIGPPDPMLGIGSSVPLDEVIQGLIRGKERAIKILKGIKKNLNEEIKLASPENFDKEEKDVHTNPSSREVFIIHGTNHGTRDKVARFLEKLELSPIILEEEANKGRTIHQKFRDLSQVAFAVALFTPDDLGSPADNPASRKPRARQNVVYELVFFGQIRR